PLRPRYDFIIIDCPPALSLLTLNALTAADSVIVPMQCEYYALEGLSALLETIEALRARLNPALEIEGVLRTMFDVRNNLANAVSAELVQHFGDKVFRTIVPRNVRLAEAPSHGQSIIGYDRGSRGGIAYLGLAGGGLRHQPARGQAARPARRDAPPGTEAPASRPPSPRPTPHTTRRPRHEHGQAGVHQARARPQARPRPWPGGPARPQGRGPGAEARTRARRGAAQPAGRRAAPGQVPAAQALGRRTPGRAGRIDPCPGRDPADRGPRAGRPHLRDHRRRAPLARLQAGRPGRDPGGGARGRRP